MKKLFFAIFSVALLFTACEKGSLPQLEQNPYRKVMEYTPGEYTMEVSGNVTPDMLYDWISVTQSGNKATFTVKRNTQDIIRRAEFTIAGQSQKAVISQKAHKLDAAVTATVVNQGATQFTIGSSLATAFADDYASWGVIYGKTSDVNAGTVVPQSGAPGKTEATIDGLEEGTDYYVWTYVESTEGDRIVSNMLAIIPPVCVSAGEDLQAAIDGAKEFQEIRVQGGVSFNSPAAGIQMGGKNVNKSVSGGWNAEFTEQSRNNLTVLNGVGSSYGFWCAEADGSPMNGYCNISYFEIINCAGNHGTAVHCVGGPITVSNCYVHDNWSEKGAIGTNEGKHATTLTVVNCNVSNNGGDGGHGPAFGFGEGKSDTEPVVATLVSNLITGNVSSKKDGYASTFIAYNQTNLVLVNNTIVGNKNWAEYGGPYSGQVLRGDIASCFVNNIMVGNYTSPCTSEMVAPEYERQEQFLNMGGGAGTLTYNIIEGSIKEGDNITDEKNIYVPTTFDVSSILTSDYKPLGQILGAGTLGTITYNSKKSEMNGPFTVDVKALLETYPYDLAGNPRVVDGKVDLGCYQAQ